LRSFEYVVWIYLDIWDHKLHVFQSRCSVRSKRIFDQFFAHLNGVREPELVNPYLTDQDYISAANNDSHSRRWLDFHPNSRMLRISGSQFHLLKSFVYITSSYTFPLKAITFFNIFFYMSSVFIPLILYQLFVSYIFSVFISFFLNSLCLDYISCIHLSLYFFPYHRRTLRTVLFYRSWFFSVADILSSGLQHILKCSPINLHYFIFLFSFIMKITDEFQQELLIPLDKMCL
jgi:hypothetical protein